MTPLFATPFHARAAGANRENAWTTRNGMTLAKRYEGTEAEAPRARQNVVIADISWRWRVMIEGEATQELLAKLVTRDPAKLAPGGALKALWLSDAGGLRGAGVVARYGKGSFELVASAPDSEWIASAAKVFGVALSDVSREAGGLAVIGPYARAALSGAGLDIDLELLAFKKLSWRGIEVTLSRWGEHGGYEIWCAPDDGVLVWDRLMAAGRSLGIAPAGTAAMDVLDLEAGVARPNLDYRPAREAGEAEPLPAELGLAKLIDGEHDGFNGRPAFMAAQPKKKLVGLELASDVPAPFTTVALNDVPVGHTLRSLYSPALKRAIALALIDSAQSALGTDVTLTLPPCIAEPRLRPASARVADLPFLAPPVSIGE